MKRTAAAALLIAAVLMLGGCAASRNTDAATFTAKPSDSVSDDAAPDTTDGISEDETAADIDALVALYKPPAEFEEIDMTADKDPSDEKMKFLFDNSGRVTGTFYQIDDTMITVTYAYDEDEKKARIIAFAQGTIVAELDVDVEKFDSSESFSEYKGYYFRGLTVKN